MDCKVSGIMASLKWHGVSYCMFMSVLSRHVADTGVCLETGPFVNADLK